MRKTIFIQIQIIALHISIVFSQVDSLFNRKEGLYLDYIQFRENKPILKSQIISNIDTAQLDFFTKLTFQKEIKFYAVNEELKNISPKELWGYFQNNTLYINYQNVFYKVPVLGAISYFIGVEEVTYYTSVGVGYPYTMGGVPIRSKEMREFLLDYYTGKVYPFTIEQLEILLQQDEKIYKEFSQLSRRQKKKKYSYYIRVFNETHPIY